jgi:hypothetical protein
MSKRDVEVLRVYEFHSFKGFNHPTRKRGCAIFLLRRKENTMGRVCQMIGTLLKAWILHQVICKNSFTGIDKNLSCSLIEIINTILTNNTITIKHSKRRAEFGSQ